jgi:oxygen-independent coproporphyrinogen-3 oxidase
VARDGHGTTHEETVQARARAREALLMGLRLAIGVEADYFAARTGLQLEDALDSEILAASLEAGYVRRTATHLLATESGRRRLDALLPRLVR